MTKLLTNHPTATDPYAGLSEAEASRVSHAVAAGVIAELRRIRKEQEVAYNLGQEQQNLETKNGAGAIHPGAVMASL